MKVVSDGVEFSEVEVCFIFLCFFKENETSFLLWHHSIHALFFNYIATCLVAIFAFLFANKGIKNNTL